jgi:hypothetical protein
MGKCKVRIHRLTLAPGAIGDGKVREELGTVVEEASRILDQERHHRAMEVLVASSSIRQPHPHVHGVKSQLRGRFWAVDSESESKSEDEVIVQLSRSLDKLSLSSPLGSLGPASGFVSSCVATLEVTETQSVKSSVGCAVSSCSVPSKHHQMSRLKPEPWAGPLPSPRVSPKVSLGDVLEKVKVFCFPSSAQSQAKSQGSTVRCPSPELGKKGVI